MRKVLKRLLLGMALALLSGLITYSCIGQKEAVARARGEGKIMTVRGPISPSEFGKALTHEHIVGSFVNLDEVGEIQYSRDDAVEEMLPMLQDLKDRGFSGLVECSTVDLGRDVEVLYRLSELADLHILANTGNYSAAGDSILLSYAYTDTVEQLADRWVAEWVNGIEDTGIKPGFIKIGVDPGPLSEIDRKMVQVAAKTHLRTGLTIACHTAEAQAALDVLETVRGEGVHPSALIVVHTCCIPDQNVHFQFAEAGAWVEYDHIGSPVDNLTIEEQVERIKAMLKKGYGDQLLLSHDSYWYDVTQPDGGETKLPYTPIADILIPALKKAGVNEKELHQLFIDNPARAFTVKVRKL
jgi:phosphotriesterase-related protein